MAQAATPLKRPERRELSETDKEIIRSQLTHILNDPLFVDTTRIKRFLRYVTEETLAGRSDRLKGYTIGLEVFDRPDDFDPQADTIVRVQAGQLRRRLELYYANRGANDEVRFTIPKGKYFPLFEFRMDPQPLTHRASDMDDLTDEGGEGKSSRLTGGPQDMIKLISEENPVVTRPGIVVMMFDDLTPEGSPSYFVDGLCAEIVSALVQFRHLRVITYNPALRTPAQKIDPSDVGERYDAQFIMTGHVRMSGEIFRVSVSLVATGSEQVLYSGNFDRRYTPDSVFEIEESIASNVAAAVAAPFGQINRYNHRKKTGRRQSIPAYEVVLRYYEMGVRPSREKAERLLKDVEAVTKDYPRFSSGFAIRALLHIFLVTQCCPGADGKVHMEAADQLSREAVKIDGDNATAHFARYQALYHTGRLEEAQEAAHRTVMLNPNDYTVLAYMSLTHALRGEVDVALAYSKSARSLITDPPDWFSLGPMVVLLMQGKFAEVDALLGSVTINDAIGLQWTKLTVLGHLDKIEEGKSLLNAMLAENPTAVSDWIKTVSYWNILPKFLVLSRQAVNKYGVEFEF